MDPILSIEWEKIKNEFTRIKDPKKKYNFLIERKRKFMLEFSGGESNNVVIWLDDEIESVKMLLQSQKTPNISTSRMEDIQNMDYSLAAIKYLFLLQKSEGARVNSITLIPEYDFLNGSVFKVAVLEYAIKYDNLILQNKLKLIYNLANEIVELWNNDLHKLDKGLNESMSYEIICSPVKNIDFPFKEIYFLKDNWGIRERPIFMGNTMPDNNRWWKKLDDFKLNEIQLLKDKSINLNGFPMQFADLSYKVSQFLKNEVFINDDRQPQNPKKDKITKSFPEYLLHTSKLRLAKNLKSEFVTEQGKGIRLMLEVLIEKKILVIENRKRKAIYNALQLFFARNIGTYQSIWNYKRNSDEVDYNSIETRINYITENLTKKNK